MHLIAKDIKKLVDDGLIHGIASTDQIKGSSLDVRLSNIILLEKKPVKLKQNNKLMFTLKNLEISDHYMHPGQFLLASLIETTLIPNNITAKFYLNSGCARLGCDQAAAISLKPDWRGKLTLELKNNTEWHPFRLYNGMSIGCIEFIRHEPTDSYDGQFQDQNKIVITGEFK